MATKSASNDQNTPYVLYHNTYSICSLMVRYTLAVRGTPHSPAAAMTVDEQMVDIFHEAQLDEDFLLNVNPKGQVSTQRIIQLVCFQDSCQEQGALLAIAHIP
jgi:hypothetical protein